MQYSRLLFGLVIVAANLHCAAMPPGARGKPRVEFRLQDLDGNTHELATYAGQVVLLDLWATWCAPCKEALPFYAELQQRYRDYGFTVIAVNVDEERDSVDEFVREFFPGGELPFVILRDDSAILAQQVSIETMPTSLIINREGKTVYMHAGFSKLSDSTGLEAQVRKALGL